MNEQNNAQATEPLYYIRNIKRTATGNCGIWWKINGNGYTCNLDGAWKVTKEHANDICRTRPEEDIPYAVSDVDAIAQRHADVQSLPECR